MKTKHELFTDVIVNFELVNSLTLMLMGDLMNDRQLSFELFEKTNAPFSVILRNFKMTYEYKIKDEKLLEQYQEFHTRVKKCSEYRNQVAHSGMVFEFSDVDVIRKYMINPKDKEEWTEDKLSEYRKYIIDTAIILLNMIRVKKE